MKTDDEIIEILKDILKWIKFLGINAVRDVLVNVLDNDRKKLIYHLSDGNRSSIEIAKLVGVSDRTVRRYWVSWMRHGIVEPVRVRGGERYKKAFELEDFGMEIPDLKIVKRDDKNEP